MPPKKNDTDANTAGILSAIADLSKKVDCLQSTVNIFQKDTEKRLKIIEEEIEDRSYTMNEMEKSLTNAHELLDDQGKIIQTEEKKVKDLKKRLDEAEKERKTMGKEHRNLVNVMEEKLNEMERRSREYSIRVKNVTLRQDADYRQVVAELLAPLLQQDVDKVNEEMEIAHPLGKPLRGKGNIIARFYSRPYRNHVLREAKFKLKNNDGGVFVTEDLTYKDYKLKQRAIPLMKEAFEQKKKTRFYRGNLYIDGKIVTIPVSDNGN